MDRLEAQRAHRAEVILKIMKLQKELARIDKAIKKYEDNLKARGISRL
jgi:hypothetical protein